MDTVDPIDRDEPVAKAATHRPRLIDWIWRPWYAKLWWIAIALFWLGAITIPWLGVQRLPVDASVLLGVALFLNPQAALPVLGFGYARKLLKYYRDQEDSDTDFDEDMNRHDDFSHGLFGRSRFMSYLSDPADPRSPLNSLNPANWRYRERRHR